MPSKKTAIFAALFQKRWNADSRLLRDPIVNLEEVLDEIVAFNIGKVRRVRLSQKNPANFYKE